MQVPYGEGVANHTGPEPCADVYKGAGEASAGEGTGQPLNRERPIIPGADTVPNVEGHVVDLWRCSLSRRSQRGGITWQRIKRLADDWLPKPKVLHPWPQQRFAVRYSR